MDTRRTFRFSLFPFYVCIKRAGNSRRPFYVRIKCAGNSRLLFYVCINLPGVPAELSTFVERMPGTPATLLSFNERPSGTPATFLSFDIGLSVKKINGQRTSAEPNRRIFSFLSGKNSAGATVPSSRGWGRQASSPDSLFGWRRIRVSTVGIRCARGR